ncbi:hypothetical protein BC628DRAFT_668292 [Trametes gibbosa]|nr:hypothetical protein BC628DRAFT_668292 [Trametes gibbosa]
MPPDRHEPAKGGSRPSPLNGDRPRSRSTTPSENCSPLRRSISLPPGTESRPRSEHGSDTVSLGTRDDDEEFMDDAPDPENDTVRVPIAPPTAGTPSGLATAGGVGAESVTAFGDEYGPDDYRVRSQRLRISPSDDWHAVTQIAADAIHDIRMLFPRASARLRGRHSHSRMACARRRS